MDHEKLIAAIERAIAGGAVLASPIPGTNPQSDANYIRTQTDIGVEPDVLETFIGELRTMPEVAGLDGAFAATPVGGGMSFDLRGVAKLLLARSLATKDIHGTVTSFVAYLKRNSTPAIAVAAISGVKTLEEIRLEQDVILMPMTSVPPSLQRGTALGQHPLFSPVMAYPISSALVMKFEFGPIFYRPPDRPPDTAAKSARAVRDRLEEAGLLLGILGLFPAFRMFWVQPEELWMTAGMGAVWETSPYYEHGFREKDVSAPQAEELASKYFGVTDENRQKILRIPLDRLNRAGRERDLADRAIDLGIALEALLLHDVNSEDRGELRFRLGLRGAWLLGHNVAERREIQRILRKAYDLRSKAVHAGRIIGNQQDKDNVARSTEVCQRLIRAMIDAGCITKWDDIVLGVDI